MAEERPERSVALVVRYKVRFDKHGACTLQCLSCSSQHRVLKTLDIDLHEIDWNFFGKHLIQREDFDWDLFDDPGICRVLLLNYFGGR